MNRVVLTGRLTRDPEMRSLASGKTDTTFTVASNEFLGGGKEKAEYSPVVTWDRLAEIAGRYLGKGQQVAIEGRLQTRSWDDEKGARHWKTEIVASHVEMLSGRRKKDYEAQQAADSLSDQAVALGEAAATEPIAEAAFDGDLLALAEVAAGDLRQPIPRDDRVVLRLLLAAAEELVAGHRERGDGLARGKAAHLGVAREATREDDPVHRPISFPVGRLRRSRPCVSGGMTRSH